MITKKTGTKKDRGFVSAGLMSQISSVITAADQAAGMPPAEQPAPDEKVEPETPTEAVTPSPDAEKAPEEQPEEKREGEGAHPEPAGDNNPYRFMKQIKGSLVSFEEPFIHPGPEGHENADTNCNIRLPISLNETIEDHCHALKINKSEWIRRAIRYLLSAEQKAIEKL